LREGIANYTALIAREGRKTAIDDSAAPMGKISGVVMIFHDVTEPRSKERARCATHMMSSTSAR